MADTSLKGALSASNLVKSFQDRTVVNGVSINVHCGTITGLLGPNGAGKTTSFYMIVGLLKPDSGSVYYSDEDITDLAMYKRARRGISYLPQNASIFRKMTVEDNFLAVMETVGMAKEERRTAVDDLLNKFQITHIRKSLGIALSGGERRRVEIARALITRPKILLLDEPFAGIDPLAVIEIQSIIKQLKDDGLGILITDHNVRETLGICDTAYVIHEGKIVASGTSDEIVNSETAKSIYLGDNFHL